MIQEFRSFINKGNFKGNFVDLAVAFVMGAAFTTVVTTFTASAAFVRSRGMGVSSWRTGHAPAGGTLEPDAEEES